MKKVMVLIITIVIILVAFLIYQKFFIPKELSIDKEIKNKMEVKSVFENNEKIPQEYTCDGDDVSPALEISDIPENTKTLAVVCDDPDAPMGTWVHWLVWNIPVDGTALKIDRGAKLGIEGTNDFKKTSYGGPCPPSGTHHYSFRVYALDSELDLAEGASKAELEKAMEGHIVGKAELVGLYSRG